MDVSLTYHGMDHHFAERLVSCSQTLCHEALIYQVLEKVRLATSAYSQYHNQTPIIENAQLQPGMLSWLTCEQCSSSTQKMLESSILVLEPLLASVKLSTVLAIALCSFVQLAICIFNAALNYTILFYYLGKEIDIMIPGQRHHGNNEHVSALVMK